MLTELRNIGFNVVATIRDQASTNSAAINRLITNSWKYLIESKQENRLTDSCAFYVEGREIIPLFDPPHLLKCIRNNFMNVKTASVSFTQSKTDKTAKWADIVQFYETDKLNENFKLCPKLTDAHVYYDKVKKMKVRMAAQVFSQSVAAAMYRAQNVEGTVLL